MTMPLWVVLLILLTALGFLRDSVLRAVLCPLDGIVWLAEQALATLARWAGQLRDAAARRLVDVDLDQGRGLASLAISCLAQTGVFLVIAATESLLVALSMATLLGLDDVAWASGSTVEVMMTGAVLVAGIYSLAAVMMLQDEGDSHLIVQQWIQPRARRLLRVLAWTAFALVSLVVLGLATIRAQELTRADAEAAWMAGGGTSPQPAQGLTEDAAPRQTGQLRNVVQVVVLLASGLSLLFSAGVAFELGVLVLLRLLPSLATAAARAVVGALRALFGTIWIVTRAVRALVRHLLEAVLAVATFVARIPAELLRALYRWGAASDRGPALLRPIRGLVAVLTSVAVDLQVPLSSR